MTLNIAITVTARDDILDSTFGKAKSAPKYAKALRAAIADEANFVPMGNGGRVKLTAEENEVRALRDWFADRQEALVAKSPKTPEERKELIAAGKALAATSAALEEPAPVVTVLEEAAPKADPSEETTTEDES